MLRAILLAAAMFGAISCEEEPYVYKNCPQTESDVLNVHIVAHTHDDVGWLKTVDQYYYGSRNNIQKAGVQYILDSVIKELWADPKRKFVYVETAFFWKWWVKASAQDQQQVKQLVTEGRLQFLGAAWSMNDEAASHYQSTIDQFTWGLSKIREIFGRRALPRVGWQIDPFGHSREFASLLAGMEFDGLFLGRIDYQDKRARLKERHMEMLWRGNDDLGNSSDIFTGVLYNTYSPPPGFCFDILCSDEPIIDDPDSPMFNVDEKILVFLDYVSKQAIHYKTNNTIITMGGDFTYQDAAIWYKNLDKLIEYSNMRAAKDGLNIKLFYSTPNCYLKSVKEANPTLPTKQDDFFPYASDPNSYWTGYFTSRPTTKYFERQGNNYLQMVKQLQVLGNLEKHNMFVVNELKSAMGIMQHHDAITGTEKEHVTHDYERLLDQAIEDATIVAKQAFNKYLQNNTVKAPIFDFNRCRLNESSCHTSENSRQFVVSVYNPLAWYTEEPIRIPVLEGNYEVYAPNGDKIDSQLVEIPKMVLNIPTRTSKATHEVVFIAYLHPLSYKSYFIRNIVKDKVKRDIKDKDLYYDRISAYWNDLKDKQFIDIENMQDEQTDVPHYAYKDVPQAKMKHVEMEEIDNFDMLRDVNGGHVGELEKLVNKGSLRKNKMDNTFSIFLEDELRMLADDPMVVERVEEDFYMEHEKLKLQISNATGQITNLLLSDGSQINFSINFYYYPGYIGDNEVSQNRSSGAYVFRPTTTTPVEVYPTKVTKITGKVVNETRIEMPNVLSVVKFYDRLQFVEHEWVVGPIPIEDEVGKEYVVRYGTNLVNNGEFFTDSNGRQVLKRKLNSRPQWNLTNNEPISSNYYPVTNEIYIQNEDDKFIVLTDRSEGGTSLLEGSVELMLHRRLLHDDAFGVGEALNEMADGIGLVVRGRHRIFITKKNDNERKHVLGIHNEPIVFIADSKHISLEEWMGMQKAHSWLNNLPDGIHLLTLEPWDDRLLLRLENYVQKSPNSTVEVDLSTIFKNLKVKAFKETTLSGNDFKNNHAKWIWNTENDFVMNFNNDYGNFGEKVMAVGDGNIVADNGFKITIKAKEIKTFIMKYDIIS